ncbi:hypothetical protein LTR78_004329 [Recurvomyces mirabilis]|uniref:Trichothecene 3-O-acetyltransferase n=1 Tax=Recurvomyces mirabilis TaxID=574656 RepID=A0AAE0WPV3_9PEZI|nr:hypothetical protein LTR78_004329 [Recurvomyces mirabilis]
MSLHEPLRPLRWPFEARSLKKHPPHTVWAASMAGILDSTELITGPSFEIELPALDALFPPHYGRRLLIFQCTSEAQRQDQLTSLRAGLKNLVQKCPFLGGTIIPHPLDPAVHDELGKCTLEPGDGLELVVKDLRSHLPSFDELKANNFQPASLPYAALVPVPHDLRCDYPYVACKAQYTLLEGGTVLTWAISHNVTDGSANNEMFRMLSEDVRLSQHKGAANGIIEVQDTSDQKPLALDRSVLRNVTSDKPFNIKEHPGYGRMPKQADAEVIHAPTTTPVCIQIPASKLETLKADATPSKRKQISTHDALAGLMWRSSLLLRSHRAAPSFHLPHSTTSTLFFPSDGRRHIGLQPNYIGNVIYQMAVRSNLEALLSASGLKHATGAIRDAITAATPELVKSYLAEVNKRWIDWAYMTADLGTLDWATGTNWTSGCIYGYDWGEAFGPLVRFRYPGEPGLNGIMPKLPDGSAEVIISVVPDEVEALQSDDFFGKYV